MRKIFSSLTLLFRFVLEISAIIGLAAAAFCEYSLVVRVLYPFLGLIIALIWSRYGAPKSTNSLKGRAKFALECFVYGLTIFCFAMIYDQTLTLIFALIVVIDLTAMYALDLERKETL